MINKEARARERQLKEMHIILDKLMIIPDTLSKKDIYSKIQILDIYLLIKNHIKTEKYKIIPDKKISELEEQLKEKIKTKNTTEEKISELEEQLKEMINNKNIKEEKISELEKQLEEMINNKNIKEEKISELEKQLEEMNRKKDMVKKIIYELIKRVKSVVKHVDIINAEQLEEQLKEMIKTKNTTEETISELEEQLEEMKRKKYIVEKRIYALKRQLKKMIRKKDTTEKVIFELEEQLEKTIRNNNISEKKISELKEQLKNMETKWVDLLFDYYNGKEKSKIREDLRKEFIKAIAKQNIEQLMRTVCYDMSEPMKRMFNALERKMFKKRILGEKNETIQIKKKFDMYYYFLIEKGLSPINSATKVYNEMRPNKLSGKKRKGQKIRKSRKDKPYNRYNKTPYKIRS